MTRGPLVEIGSLETWTRMSWPALQHILDRAAPCAAAAARVRALVRRRVVVLVVVVIVVVVAVLVEDEVGRVKERALLGADVDERRLDARKHRFDLAEVDVADHAAGCPAVDEQLDKLVVLQDRDARLARRRR